MKNEDQLEESICDTCTAGMCDICSERHTNSYYQLNQEEAGEFYNNLEKENPVVKKEYNSNEMKVGDIIKYQYDVTSSARTVEAEVTYIDNRTKAYYVKYKGRYNEVIEERAKTFL